MVKLRWLHFLVLLFELCYIKPLYSGNRSSSHFVGFHGNILMQILINNIHV